MKNPNGYGCVIKLSGKRRKPYAARVTNGFKIIKDKKTGEEKRVPDYKYLDYFENSTDAMLCLAKRYENNDITIPSKMTLENVYNEWWNYKFYDGCGLSDSVKNQYSEAFGKLHKIHKKEFVKIKKSDYQNIINEYALTCKNGTLDKIRVLLREMYYYAIEERGICEVNHALRLKLKPIDDREETEPYTEYDLDILWQNTDDKIVQAILVFAYTGLRVNEGCTLTVFNVNLERKIIKQGSKTRTGKNREVPIHDKIYPILKELCENAQDGNLFDFNYHQFRYQFQKTMKRLGIQNRKPNSGRYTFTTRMATKGADMKVAQKVVGHKHIKTTLGKYERPDEEFMRKEVNKI